MPAAATRVASLLPLVLDGAVPPLVELPPLLLALDVVVVLAVAVVDAVPDLEEPVPEAS